MNGRVEDKPHRNVHEHYEYHLGSIYAWMTGDFRTRCDEFKQLLTEQAIVPSANKVAWDLGSAHGIQSIPLAEAGFQVLAVDFNQQLLQELQINAQGLPIRLLNGDIRNVSSFSPAPELIVCCGDTLTHLDDHEDVRTFLLNLANALRSGGTLIVSFRDYARELKGVERFIPVKQDETKLLTCVLEYEVDWVYVTDVLHTQVDGKWQQQVSTYRKVRLLEEQVLEYLKAAGLHIRFHHTLNRMITIIATKEPL